MKSTVAAVMVASLALGGCGSFGKKSKEPAKERLPSLGWFCDASASGDKKVCQKRWLLDGQPVDDIVYETMEIAAEAPEPAPPPQPSPASHQGQRWNKKSVTAINALGNSADLGVENLGPEPRKIKNTVDVWKTPMKKQAVVTQPPPQKTASAKPVGYTVQLGAFASFDKCRAFFASPKMRGVPMYMRKIYSDGTPWWVVTQGEFATFAEAELAAKEMVPYYAPAVPWARSWAVIDALQKP